MSPGKAPGKEPGKDPSLWKILKAGVTVEDLVATVVGKLETGTLDANVKPCPQLKLSGDFTVTGWDGARSVLQVNGSDLLAWDCEPVGLVLGVAYKGRTPVEDFKAKNLNPKEGRDREGFLNGLAKDGHWRKAADERLAELGLGLGGGGGRPLPVAVVHGLNEEWKRHRAFNWVGERVARVRAFLNGGRPVEPLDPGARQLLADYVRGAMVFLQFVKLSRGEFTRMRQENSQLLQENSQSWGCVLEKMQRDVVGPLQAKLEGAGEKKEKWKGRCRGVEERISAMVERHEVELKELSAAAARREEEMREEMRAEVGLKVEEAVAKFMAEIENCRTKVREVGLEAEMNQMCIRTLEEKVQGKVSEELAYVSEKVDELVHDAVPKLQQAPAQVLDCCRKEMQAGEEGMARSLSVVRDRMDALALQCGNREDAEVAESKRVEAVLSARVQETEKAVGSVSLELGALRTMVDGIAARQNDDARRFRADLQLIQGTAQAAEKNVGLMAKVISENVDTVHKTLVKLKTEELRRKTEEQRMKGQAPPW